MSITSRDQLTERHSGNGTFDILRSLHALPKDSALVCIHAVKMETNETPLPVRICNGEGSTSFGNRFGAMNEKYDRGYAALTEFIKEAKRKRFEEIEASYREK